MACNERMPQIVESKTGNARFTVSFLQAVRQPFVGRAGSYPRPFRTLYGKTIMLRLVCVQALLARSNKPQREL